MFPFFRETATYELDVLTKIMVDRQTVMNHSILSLVEEKEKEGQILIGYFQLGSGWDHGMDNCWDWI
jgi:hypothetical protein